MVFLALRAALEASNAAQNLPFDSRHLYLSQVIFPALAMLIWRKDHVELPHPPVSLQAWVASLGTGLLIFALWIIPGPAWTHLEPAATHFAPDGTDQEVPWQLLMERGFGAVLVVPAMEEIFWRSFFMRWIDRRDFLHLPACATSVTAIILSSAVFALAHELWLAAFLAGLAYALLYRVLGNLWYCVIAHATTNLALALWVVHEHAWQYW